MGPQTERLSGPLHRSGLLFREVAKASADPTFASVQGVDQVTGQTAEARPILQRALSRAAAGATGAAKAVLDTLLAWDGNYTRTDAAGTVDPGVATWDAFRTAVVDQGVRRPYGSIAVSLLESEVMKITGSLGSAVRMRSKRSSPDDSGSRISNRTTSD